MPERGHDLRRLGAAHGQMDASECRSPCSPMPSGSAASTRTVRHGFDERERPRRPRAGVKTKSSGRPAGCRAIIACAAAGRPMMRGLPGLPPRLVRSRAEASARPRFRST